MVIVFVIVGFIAGIGVGSSIVACALTDPLGAALLVAHQVTLDNRTARKAVPRCLFLSQPAVSCSRTRDTRWSRLRSLAAWRRLPPPPSGRNVPQEPKPLRVPRKWA